MNERPEDYRPIGNGLSNLPVSQYKDVLAALPEDVKLDRVPRDEALPAEVIWQDEHILVRHDISIEHPALRALGAVMAKDEDGNDLESRAGMSKLLKINGNAREAVEELRSPLGGGVWLNNLMTICGVNMCPADEPLPSRRGPLPRWHEGGDGGDGVFVEVIDTGLAYGWEDHPWLEDEQKVTGDKQKYGNTYRPGGDIRLDVGHGEFIAGILRCVSPKLRVKVDNLFKWAGTMFEFQVRDAILDALNATPKPDIINLSAGCTTLNGEPPQAMKEVIQALSAPGNETLLVAAAGNDGLREGPGSLFYPAAFAREHEDFVVAVGALRQSGKGRACFSNFGDFVSVYDEGERLVNAFPNGRYTYHEPIIYSSGSDRPRCFYFDEPIYDGCTCVTGLDQGVSVEFTGMARWSGTSFSTPIVAAKVANYMQATGEKNARQAWKSLYSQHHVVVDTAGGFKLKVLP